MDITPEILAEAGEMLKNHLRDYSNDIDTAFNNLEEDLAVSLKVKLGVYKGQVKVETGINFPIEKVKDADTRYFDPNQKELFPDGEGEGDE